MAARDLHEGLQVSRSFEAGPPAPGTIEAGRIKKIPSNIVKQSSSLNGTTLGGALVVSGQFQNLDQAEDSEGGQLNIFQAFMVSFCIAFGAGIALVGWYPQLAGNYGYAFCIVLVSVVGAVAENALHVTCIKTKASSFGEMTRELPSWMSMVTACALVSWGFTIAGLYVQFVFSFINRQILEPMDIGLENDGGGDSWKLYIPIGVSVFFVVLPPKFGGPVVKAITAVNLFTTWMVIITAVVKGVYMGNTHEPRPAEYRQLRLDGFMQVIVLLAGAMFQCGSVPRLQYELRPDCRERAAWLIPLSLGAVQGGIFLIVGLVGYFALGECLLPSGDVFASYAVVANDAMVTILQGGIALLMFLSLPLLSVSPKNELWSLFGVRDSEGYKVQIEDAPMPAQMALSLLLVIYAVAMPMVVGRARLTNIVTVLGGTAANWNNLFLPGFVIIYSMILPAMKAGEPYQTQAIKVTCIFVLALACFWSSLVRIWNMVSGNSASTPDVIDEDVCWNVTF